MNDIDVVYTLWANLHKSESMEVGQVGFHKQKEVRKIRVSRRDNAIINRLNKTKREEKVASVHGDATCNHWKQRRLTCWPGRRN